MSDSDWERTRLADVLAIRHGYAFAGEYFRDEPPGDILLTPGNFAIGGGFKKDKLKYYVGPVPPEFVLREGDLLVTMTDLSKGGDTLGYPAFVPAARGFRYLHNQRLGKIEITRPDRLDRRYLYYLLCTEGYRHEVLASATGSTVRHTSPGRISDFCTSLPPLTKQKAIASILGPLDDKIELNRRMNQTLEALAAALFKAWFVDEAAEGQSEGPLGEVADIVMGQSPPGDTYNENGSGLPFYQGTRDFGSRFPTRRVYCSAPTRLARKGDVLLSVRAPVGSLNVAAEECAIGRGLAALRPKWEPGGYLLYALKATNEGWAKFEAEGTVFGSASRADVQGFRLPVPTLSRMQDFGRLVEPLDRRIEANERESRTLAELRDTLLPKLLSGELRVKQAEQLAGVAV